jgi:GT2 family glycosyltransferase
MPLDLSIIIVNWNSAGYVRKCLSSIYANTRELQFEVIVVDNASHDGCGEMLVREYPNAIFIQSHQNLGFARANNLGFQSARGRALLFLNPDTELVGPALNTLFGQLQTLPGAGAVGAKLLNTDRSLQTSCIQSLPTVLNQTLDIEFLRARSPRSRLWGMAPLFSGESAPAEVEVISGACLMLNRDLFEKVGRFSEDYFMYSEDLDLCFKLKQAGRKNYYVPAAALIHHGGGSSQRSQSQFSSVMVRDSVCRFLAKTRGQCYAVAYRSAMSLSAAFRLLLLAVVAPLGLFSQKRRASLSALRKWFAVFKWSLGLETWVKNYRPPSALSS